MPVHPTLQPREWALVAFERCVVVREEQHGYRVVFNTVRPKSQLITWDGDEWIFVGQVRSAEGEPDLDPFVRTLMTG